MNSVRPAAPSIDSLPTIRSRRIGRSRLCLGALLAVALGTARAERLGAQVVDDTASLPRVVVTATRVPFSQAVSTTSTTVITGDDLRARGILTVGDALRDAPGIALVQTGSVGGLTSLFLRGGESGYTKVLLDGIPLNEPGGTFYFQNLTAADIDRIEIVRGPTSVLYGSDAVSGTVQIFTKEGAGAVQGALTARGGNYKTADGALDVSGAAGPLGFSLGGTRETTAGVLPFNNQLTNGELAGRLDVGHGSPSSASLVARYHTADYHFPTLGSGIPVDHNQQRRDEGASLGVSGQHAITSRVDAHLALTTTAQDAANINPPDGPADTVGTFSTFNRDAFRRDAADVHLDAHVGAAAVATVGGSLEGQIDRTRSFDRFNFPGPGGAAGSDTVAPAAYFRRVGAAYAQVVGNIGPSASYTAGARLDDNSAFGTFPTYRLGVGYALGFGAQLHANVGTAFKEPTVEQNFSRVAFDVGNPSLRPEHSVGWEVGVAESPFGPGLTLSATYFNQRFHDIIDYSFAGFPVRAHPGDTTNFVNIAGAIANGIETGLIVGPVSGTSLELTYTGLLTRVTNNGVDQSGYSQFRVGTRLIRRPAHEGSGTFRSAVGRRGSLATTVRYIGARDDINFGALSGGTARVVLPGFTTVDLAGDYVLLSGGATGPTLSLTARVTNLLARRYEEVYSYAAPGRTVLVGGRLAIHR